MQRAEGAARETLSPVERVAFMLHTWIGFVVTPLFAFASAGVALSPNDLGHPVPLTVFVGLALGKPLGIVGFNWLAVRTGVAAHPFDLG